MKEINNLIQCIVNARVNLEQGGKYDWNEELQSCDEWLKQAIDRLKRLESNLTFALLWEKDGEVLPKEN